MTNAPCLGCTQWCIQIDVTWSMIVTRQMTKKPSAVCGKKSCRRKNGGRRRRGETEYPPRPVATRFRNTNARFRAGERICTSAWQRISDMIEEEEREKENFEGPLATWRSSSRLCLVLGCWRCLNWVGPNRQTGTVDRPVTDPRKARGQAETEKGGLVLTNAKALAIGEPSRVLRDISACGKPTPHAAESQTGGP
ncbi:uncharacterized protein B0I36DRAFT_318218 [Microdochium trichocladiopsis]|uniref:Uncharacterized protein n=1 Tax=Microdochium trichocladiopsis TaxID=1682393 RepID=A0A9P8YBS5_9PEZI|nr:uncharacterized protein B0I36DRAFT_318218 [Microdochium trichocladiopsis]KAH7035377.1 hypothetical protein B0I36DRAFT_318218 [Microdochium trichocladiopsis]